MKTRLRRSFLPLISSMLLCVNISMAESKERMNMDSTDQNPPLTWQEQSARYARIMSQVQWTPVADGIPHRRDGHFEKGTEYTGVPYSSVRWKGRYIGFDIFLKTFLAAVENPESVLYTENLAGKVPNAATYYGKVCSSFTSYALQCGIWYVSRLHVPPHRDGVKAVEPQSAQAAEIGDIIFTPPTPGGHVEIVTGITRDDGGKVTHVRVEDSWPETTRTINRRASNFNSHISSGNRKLYRITDLDAWRGENRAEHFRFPNFEEDSAAPEINSTLLLDLGDWVPYHIDQPVKFNVMDGAAETLVIKRAGEVVEEVGLSEPGVIERSFEICGDYTAHCIMSDGSLSQACEFAVCDLDFDFSVDEVTLGESWEIEFSSCNMHPVIVHLYSEENPYARHYVWITDQDRQNGRVVITDDTVDNPGRWQVWLIGENRYGRLKERKDITAGPKPGDIPLEIPTSVSRALGGAEAVTVSAWVARDARAMGRRNDILQIPISGTSVKIGLMFTADDTLRASGRTEVGENVQGVNTLESWDGKMRHVAAVYGAADNDISIYVDGVKRATEGRVEWRNDAFSAQTGQPGAIGMAARGEHHFSGKIEDVRIYSNALTEEEIQAVFKAKKTDKPGENLVRRWLHPDAVSERQVRPAGRGI